MLEALMGTTVHKHKMVITHPAYLWLMGTMELRRVNIRVYVFCVRLFFHRSHERREMCVYVRQVLNAVSNGTQGMLVYLCVYVCVCACLYVWVSLLVCALHPRAMVAPFLIRTIIVGLSPGSTSWPLTPVKICQVNFLRICCDHGILSAGRQQALEFLKIKNKTKKPQKKHTVIQA